MTAQSAENQIPAVRIAVPQEGNIFAAPADITMWAVASDPDGWVTTVEFFADGTSLGVTTNNPLVLSPINPFHLTWSNAPAGEHALTARATDNGGASAMSDPIHIKVLDPTVAPVVTISAEDRAATEQSPLVDAAPDMARLVVHRTARLDERLVVHYRVSGTAENGVDYVKLSGEVEFPAGSATADIIVNPLDDTLVEGTETVVVTLEPSDCTAADPLPAGCYVLGRAREALAYLFDNDEPPNTPPHVAIISPPDGAVFVAPEDIRIVANASDSDGWVQTVEFFDGTTSLGIVTNYPVWIEPFGVPVLEDDFGPLPWPINPFQLVWSNPPPGHHILTALATDNKGASTKSGPVEISILEISTQPVVTVSATDPVAAEGSSDPTADGAIDTATFTVRRTGAVDFPLTVFYKLGGAAENGRDYRELPSSVTIPEGESSANVVIQPIDDELVEGSENVVLTLQAPACIDIFPPPRDCYPVGRSHEACAIIFDNDGPTNRPPYVRIVQPFEDQVFLAGADIRLTAAARDIDGSVKSGEFFEGEHSLGVVTIPDPVPLIPCTPEFCPEWVPQYSLMWSNVPPGRYVLTAVATDDTDASTRSRPVEIKVVDVKPPPVVSIETIDSEAAEQLPVGAPIPFNDAIFRVSRTGPTNDSLAVFYCVGGTAKNGVDYQELSGRVLIQAGSESADIRVRAIDDDLCEGTETVVARLEPTACITIFPPPPASYLIGLNSQARAVILDNEQCPSNQPPVVQINDPHDGEVFVAPTNIRLAAYAQDREDGYEVTVEFFEGEHSLGFGTFVPTLCPAPFCPFFSLTWSNVPPGEYVLTAKATDKNGGFTVSAPVHIKVGEVSIRPVVTIEAKDAIATEGFVCIGPPGSEAPCFLDWAALTVHRSGPTNADLTVLYHISGSASNGVDYGKLTGQVTIPAGSRSADIAIDPLEDDLVEGTETVRVTLVPNCIVTDPANGGCYAVGDPGSAEAFIRDNDPEVNQPPRVEIVKPHSGEVFQAPADITIVAAARDPDGWVHLVEFFANGDKIGEQSIEFIQAPPPGQLQEFSFNWTGVRPGLYVLTAKATDDDGATTMSGPVAIVVVETSEPPIVTIRAVDCLAIEGTPPNTASFRVRRTGPTNDALLVFYSVSGTASNGVDYTELAGTVTIPAGRHSARITVTPIDDDLRERVESVVVTLAPSPAASPIEPYRIGFPHRAGAVIVDNDQPFPITHCLPDHLFHLCLPGENGFVYRLECSTDLVNWTPLCDSVVVDGAVHYVDTEAPDSGHRFYRVRADVDLAVEADD